jgi:hypothetical protein
VTSCELEGHFLFRAGVGSLSALGDDELHAAGSHFQLALRRIVLRAPCRHLETLAVHADHIPFAQMLVAGFRLFPPDRDPHPGGGLTLAVALVNRQVEVGNRLSLAT